jgi:hypothetical protein
MSEYIPDSLKETETEHQKMLRIGREVVLASFLVSEIESSIGGGFSFYTPMRGDPHAAAVFYSAPEDDLQRYSEWFDSLEPQVKDEFMTSVYQPSSLVETWKSLRRDFFTKRHKEALVQCTIHPEFVERAWEELEEDFSEGETVQLYRFACQNVLRYISSRISELGSRPSPVQKEFFQRTLITLRQEVEELRSKPEIQRVRRKLPGHSAYYVVDSPGGFDQDSERIQQRLSQ